MFILLFCYNFVKKNLSNSYSTYANGEVKEFKAICFIFSNFRTYETLVKKIALLKAVDGFRYILSLFRSHHLMAGQT